jgi:hypothetical protein
VVNKKILLCICLLPIVLFLVTSCNLNKDGGSDSIVLTQSSIENNIESSDDVSEDNSKNDVRMIETDKDEDFYKRLILRLLRNEIAIMDGENKYYFSDTVSVDYEKMLPESKFFIVDINGDKKLDIGIRFPSNVLLTYYYNEETDTLSQALDHHIYTEILGNGQVMMASSSSTSEATFYNVIDIFGEDISTVVFFEDYMGESILSDGTKVPKYLYSVEVRMRLPEGTRRPNNTISTIDVTKEQWDMMRKPFEDLRKNAPTPFNYEELMEVES